MRLWMAVFVLVVLARVAIAASLDDLQKLKETGSCPECDLRGADLIGAKLQGADLRKADLGAISIEMNGGFVGIAKLREADLSDANLTGAKLNGADLRGANLRKANVSEADLWQADLQEANLFGAIVVRSNLLSANLRKATLDTANLSGSDLTGADLMDASLLQANLSGVDLNAANLRNADLFDVDLTGANLSKVDLSGAGLFETNLSQAQLWNAKLTNVLYEPKGSPPIVGTMWNTSGLSTLRWEHSPHGLTGLREAFKKSGMREQERQVTYSIMHWERRNTGGIWGWLQFILFEATCDFGLSPGRPLLILTLLICGFSVVYMISIASSKITKSGIWRVWENDRVMKNVGTAEPQRLTERNWQLPFWGLWFSTIAAFQFGWRDLNVGNWIARINPYEYTLRPTGWVKSLSGIQSLISLYLIALSILAYFGRPFG